MSYRNREIESKLILQSVTLQATNAILNELYGESKSKLLFGSSIDTYWTIPAGMGGKADFIRARERDGIVELTTKGKDRNTNLNRMEIDVKCVSSIDTVHAFVKSLVGEYQGTVSKTYYVYWLNKNDTVCCYTVQFEDGRPDYQHVIIEVEASHTAAMLALEATVLDKFRSLGYTIDRAPGSLYEMFILNNTKETNDAQGNTTIQST